MRALLQRVKKANVTVLAESVGAIDHGLVVFLGVTQEDGEEAVRWLANKIAGLRIFEDEAGKMNLSVKDVDGEVLVVSQFTLSGDARKGRRPSFTSAARPDQAKPLVESFSKELRELGIPVSTGVFGARMQVEIINDGPVTMMLEK
jgi:D-tyrosyl-tRNA(Tyr) deacylase